jgi:hypothetical protein
MLMGAQRLFYPKSPRGISFYQDMVEDGVLLALSLSTQSGVKLAGSIPGFLLGLPSRSFFRTRSSVKLVPGVTLGTPLKKMTQHRSAGSLSLRPAGTCLHGIRAIQRADA